MAWNPLTLGRASASSDNLLKSLLIPQKAIAVRLILFSAITNMAALAMSLFMMQVFDRVLTSQSKDTLFFLALAITLVIGLCLLYTSDAADE